MEKGFGIMYKIFKELDKLKADIDSKKEVKEYPEIGFDETFYHQIRRGRKTQTRRMKCHDLGIYKIRNRNILIEITGWYPENLCDMKIKELKLEGFLADESGLEGFIKMWNSFYSDENHWNYNPIVYVHDFKYIQNGE